MAVPSVQVPTPQIANNPADRGGPAISFRHATTERSLQLQTTSQALTAGTQVIEQTVDGSGFMYGIDLLVTATAAGNVANVAFQEDAPYSALDTIELRDVGGDIANVTGYGAHIAQVINHDYAWRDPNLSANAALVTAVPGNVANGGTFAYAQRVPVANNRRELIGALGNQDRAQQYQLRTILAGSAAVYSTAPTTLPTMQITRMYESYTVPAPIAPNGQRQMQLPPWYGSIRFTTEALSESSPVGGAQVQHFVRRIANTIRWQALVGRVNGSRVTFQANLPTAILLTVGDEPIFNETSNYRMALNFERHGQVMDPGVLVYDNIHDFWPGAGNELGYDYWYTQIVQNMKYQCNYPAGVGSTNNSLRIITDDMVLRRPQLAA